MALSDVRLVRSDSENALFSADGGQAFARLPPAIDDRVETVQQELADAFFEAGVIGKRIDVRAIFDKRFNALLGAQTP